MVVGSPLYTESTTANGLAQRPRVPGTALKQREAPVSLSTIDSESTVIREAWVVDVLELKSTFTTPGLLGFEIVSNETAGPRVFGSKTAVS